MTKSLFAQAVESVPELHAEMADKFEVAKGTITRWANGTANPHPLLRVQVLRYITDKTMPPVSG